MDCIIIDDEPAAIRIVEKYISEIPTYLEIKSTFYNAAQAISYLKENTIDLIFLDINMPGLSGLEFIKSLAKPPLFIFTTAYCEYAIDAFALDAVDYLHKPFSFDRFFRAVQKAENRMPEIYKYRTANSTNDSINAVFIKSDKKQIRVSLDDIQYIESIGDYCKVVTNKDSIITYLTLKNFDDILPSYFIRTHKSFIINSKKIKSLYGNTVELITRDIPIGQSFRKKVYTLLNL